MPISPIEWRGGLDGSACLVDQARLPLELVWIECQTVEQMWDAIKQLKVRGAPAIGVAAAMGLVLAVRESKAASYEAFECELEKASDFLGSSRPTAVNLFWALDRMKRVARENRSMPVSPSLKQRLLDEALAIREEDRAMCISIGQHGEPLLNEGDGVLTHCNAGTLATSQYGTALAPVYRAHEVGKQIHVFADETRPLLQGARLTTWELMQEGIDVTLICDNMAAQVMKEGRVQKIIVGADRIAANGDTANKIGTYGVAILAAEHGIPLYVAAPVSTFDPALASGDEIPIEERGSEEITEGFGRRTAPHGVKTYCPAFDVTPAKYITAFITNKGVIHPPFPDQIQQVFQE